MKILLAHKFNFLKGGADKYFLELAEALEKNGHTVIKFCMQHPHNAPDKHENYFVSQVEFKGKGLWKKMRYAGRLLYSFEAKRKFARLIEATKPDVIHIHNIYHQISPSILSVAKKYKVPVVMHLHDYKLISPNYMMFSRGKIDDSCVGGAYYRCLFKRSFNNSVAQSLLATIEMYFHHSVLKLYEKNIDMYITPSKFMREQVLKAGIPADKIRVIPYFVSGIEDDKPNYSAGDYFLFFGRLSAEKGVDHLLRAAALAREIKVRIVGEGSELSSLRALTQDLGIKERVEFFGPLYGADLKEMIRQSRAVVVPSLWYEVLGLVNIEAQSLGKMVIAADIGGIKEALSPFLQEWQYPFDSISALAQRLKNFPTDSRILEKEGTESRAFVLEHFSLSAHLPAILRVYEEVRMV